MYESVYLSNKLTRYKYSVIGKLTLYIENSVFFLEKEDAEFLHLLLQFVREIITLLYYSSPEILGLVNCLAMFTAEEACLIFVCTSLESILSDAQIWYILLLYFICFFFLFF